MIVEFPIQPIGVGIPNNNSHSDKRTQYNNHKSMFAYIRAFFFDDVQPYIILPLIYVPRIGRMPQAQAIGVVYGSDRAYYKVPFKKCILF